MLLVPGPSEVVRLRLLPTVAVVLAIALEGEREAGQPRQALECRLEALIGHRSGHRSQGEILQHSVRVSERFGLNQGTTAEGSVANVAKDARIAIHVAPKLPRHTSWAALADRSQCG